MIFCHTPIGSNPITHRSHIQIKMPISYDCFTRKETSQTTKLIEPPKKKNIKLDILIEPPIGRVFSLQLNRQKETTKLIA